MALDRIDYRAVLADLQKKRAELDAAIVAVRQLLNLETDQRSNHDAAPNQHAQKHEKTRHRRSKLTTEQIARIKARHAEGMTQVEIAQEFGVSRGTVWNVVNGKRD